MPLPAERKKERKREREQDHKATSFQKKAIDRSQKNAYGIRYKVYGIWYGMVWYGRGSEKPENALASSPRARGCPFGCPSVTVVNREQSFFCFCLFVLEVRFSRGFAQG